MIYRLDADTLIFMIRGLKSSNRHPASRERAQKLVDRCRQAQAEGDTLARIIHGSSWNRHSLPVAEFARTEPNSPARTEFLRTQLRAMNNPGWRSRRSRSQNRSSVRGRVTVPTTNCEPCARSCLRLIVSPSTRSRHRPTPAMSATISNPSDRDGVLPDILMDRESAPGTDGPPRAGRHRTRAPRHC